MRRRMPTSNGCRSQKVSPATVDARPRDFYVHVLSLRRIWWPPVVGVVREGHVGWKAARGQILKNLMEDKRIDLDAPLLSARRFSAGVASPAPSVSKGEKGDLRPPPPRRSSLPFYKSDLKSGPVRVPGVVPFVWEQTPGQPKEGSVPTPDGKPLSAPKPPPGRNLKQKDPDLWQAAAAPAAKLGNSVRTRKAVAFACDGATAAISSESPLDAEVSKAENKLTQESVPAANNLEEGGDDDDDAFSDALDTLSRAESLLMNCSVSGVSGMPDAAKLSGSVPKDPQVRDFMMERFLPAAQAMVCESTQYTFRKAAGPPREATKPVERVAINDRNSRPPAPMPYQNKPDYFPQYAKELEEGDINDDDVDEEYSDDDSGHLPSKACGLLSRFCLKDSFCLLNPVTRMKDRGRLPPPPRGRTRDPQIWNLHRLSLGPVEDENSWETLYRHKLGQNYRPQVAEVSKLRSESDSQTADGSVTGGSSPYQDEGNGFLGNPRSKSSKTDDSDAGDKDINHWETNHSSSRIGLVSMSPALEKTLYIDLTNRPGSSDSKSSSFNTVKDTRSMPSSGEVGTGSRRMEESFVAEACEGNTLQLDVSKVAEPVLPFSSRKPNHMDMNGDDNHKHVDNDRDTLHLSGDINPLRSLLPPPLPKSPSESWLSRTLPSVRSKNPAPRSLLGVPTSAQETNLAGIFH
ncbi:hypothetical protein BHE74_00011493 [Ensete ventricosum]|nr:hypothetical protein BHE74_00011493 [Ensete ventricosum]